MVPPDTQAELIAHAGFVRNLAFRLLRDAHEAEDVVQQVFLAAVKRPPEPDRPLRPWLKRVAHNFAIDMHRSRGRRQQSEMLAAQEDLLEPSADDSVLESAREELAATVLSLAEPYRTVILLRFYDELAPAAIARRLDVPIETVRTRLKRGVALLRARLQGGDDDKRRLWAVSLRRLAGEPSDAMRKPVRWKTLIEISAAAAIGAVCVWLWSSAPHSPTPAAVVRTLPPNPTESSVDPLRRDSKPDEATQKALPPPKEAGIFRVRVVTDEGEVIVPDARVDIFSEGTQVAEAHTDRNGEIEISRELGTNLEIRIGMTRISLAYSAPVTRDSAHGDRELSVVRVPAASSVRGRVVDAEGFAVPYARILGWSGEVADDDWRWRTPSHRSIADRNGEFAILGLRHHFRLEAIWGHLVARDTFIAHLEHAQELKDIELHVCEPRTIHGRIVDEFGIAVTDARITTVSPESEQLRSHADTSIVPRDGDVSKSGPDGSFVITGIAAGAPGIVVEHPDHAPRVIPPPTSSDLDENGTVDVGLEVGVDFDVWVSDAYGNAAVGAAARIFDVSGSVKLATADAFGRIHFDHLPSNAAGFLRVDAPGLEAGVREIKKLAKKHARLEVDLGLPRCMRGRLIDSARIPVRGAIITARLAETASGPEDPAWRAARDRASALGEYLTTDDGSFGFPGTPWRALVLDVRTPQGTQRTFHVDYDQVSVECALDAGDGPTNAGSR